MVKASRSGSSLGSNRVRSARDLEPALESAWEISDAALVEEFIPGRELTCGVLDFGGPARALPVTEIRPPGGEFFDYEAKYSGKTREITPAPVPPAISRRVQVLSLRVHATVGARGFSRTDFILAGRRLTCLEINTIPGLTRQSLLPQAIRAAGLSLAGVFAGLVRQALETKR